MATWDPTAAYSNDLCVQAGQHQDAEETLLRRFGNYSADPTTSWTNAEREALLMDSGWGAAGIGTALNPRLAIFQQVTSGGTNGTRYLCFRYIKWAAASASLTLPGSQPYTADEAYGDVDCTTALDGSGFQDHDDVTVSDVLVRFSVIDTGTLGTGSANAVYIAVRKKGDTTEQRFSVMVSNVLHYYTVWIPIDTDEIFQFSATVANTSASMTVTADLLGFMETI